MSRKIKTPSRRKGIIFLAIVISVILYLAGVYSGLYANKIIKEETEKDIETIKEKTEQDLDILETYLNFLDTNLKNMQPLDLKRIVGQRMRTLG